MAFTPKAPEFLYENYSRNDKEWFRKHKDIYEKEVVLPMREMIEYLSPLMDSIDPMIVCSPRKVSRIYRDVRLIKDGMFFKQSIWFSLMRPKERFDSKPEFFFWINPENFGWGCGYYHIATPVMENIRSLILARDKTAMDAIAAYEAQQTFVLEGEMYKRDRFPEEPENLKNWLNRKNLSVYFQCEDPELFFSDGLKERVRSDFEMIAPVYKLFVRAEDMEAAKNEQG
ncbi:DUF2461 domain-containing protein [Ruminococcus sp.]|uniref:DUF2461 domain-containing protein n=1 Tax=Ruminococcus sp. TaxID=41978 RepID=UPI0025F1428B|nr:DUF2461 domain-containing protein [Ruminococcus sp.]MBQ8966123.1 DUF2461 domain-containing protein [Ruminococcus sp.]